MPLSSGYGELLTVFNLEFFVMVLKIFFIDIPKAIWDKLAAKNKHVVGQVVAISGGAQGIGKEMAQIFALELGAKVAIMDIQREANEKTAGEIRKAGGHATAFQCDITNPDAVRECAAQIQEDPNLGPPDIIICNAGVLLVKELTESTDKEIKRTMDINVLGVFWITESMHHWAKRYFQMIRAFLSTMKERNHGQIVAISSMAGHFGQYLSPDYCASKFAVRGLMESLTEEVRFHNLEGIITTSIYPFFINTPMVKDCQIKSKYFSMLEPIEAARHIVDAILKERHEAFIPPVHETFSTAFKGALPHRAIRRIRDFLGISYK